jgi:hypothetical protein
MAAGHSRAGVRIAMIPPVNLLSTAPSFSHFRFMPQPEKHWIPVSWSLVCMT